MGGVAWSEEEDHLLRKCIEQYGEGKWHRIPLLAGINRCRKSCRLRWLNYLRPNIKRGKFTDEEVELIIKLHKLLGNRWSLIAGRLPGRTANDVKNYWHCHLNKRLNSHMGKSNAITCNTKTTEEKIIIMESSRNEATKDEFHAQVHNNNVASSVSTNNKEIIPCVFQGNSYEDSNNVTNQQKEVKIISCEESMAIEEFPMDIDFDLEEIKISGSDHRKYNNWDFDDLLFNMEI